MEMVSETGKNRIVVQELVNSRTRENFSSLSTGWRCSLSSCQQDASYISVIDVQTEIRLAPEPLYYSLPICGRIAVSSSHSFPSPRDARFTGIVKIQYHGNKINGVVHPC